MGDGKGREGDWECSSCGNRNYAFRSFCNRCKKPRILVDTKTPADSKWLPRIGDWICAGCSNNNYASREKCKKCGQPKEEASIPAIAIRGGPPAHEHYFPGLYGLPGLKMNYDMAGSSLRPSLLPNSVWSTEMAAKYGLQSTSPWPFSGSSTGVPYAGQLNEPASLPNGWRNGDWICNCGFHNYSSREECKRCNTPLASCRPSAAVNSAVSALGTKRLATDELYSDWDNKRLNAGYPNHPMLVPHHSYQGFGHLTGSINDQSPATYSRYGNGVATSSVQLNVQVPHLATMPATIGTVAKHWRDGDWMCSNCNNHNYASRSLCNRCNSGKEASLPVSVP